MEIRIYNQPYDPWVVLSTYNRQHQQLDGPCGATDVFVGWMRDHNEGDNVATMFLEHYPGMTERELERVAQESVDRHQLLDLFICHRVGEVRPGEAIVIVATYAAHRKAAFDACREVMEALKSRVPFWKRESVEDGERWVEKNTTGY